jgi:mitogen-activated protein kinase kinase
MYSLSKNLAELHEKKLVHEDIKQENVLVQKNGNVKIIDFAGLSKMGGEIQEGIITTYALTSPRYFSTNMLSDTSQQEGEINDKNDVWMFGMFLLQSIDLSLYKRFNSRLMIKRANNKNDIKV